jgi:hypothetical protein
MLGGCQSAYYAAWEKLGVEKRDILVDRVDNAKEAQQEAQQQFTSALEELSQIIQFDGGELEQTYKALSEQLAQSRAASDAVTARVDKVEAVASALFEEWNKELGEYSNTELRRASEQKIKQTQRNYDPMMKVMRKAEASMQPVLTTLNDNVLFLKHNLNANAIGALKTELTSVQKEIKQVINQMQASVAASDQFIRQMNQ